MRKTKTQKINPQPKHKIIKRGLRERISLHEILVSHAFITIGMKKTFKNAHISTDLIELK